MNDIKFDNPASYPPDLDRIVISGDGDELLPTSTTYEAEYATLVAPQLRDLRLLFGSFKGWIHRRPGQ